MSEEIKQSVETKTDDLKSLVEKNLKWSQVIYEQNKKIKRRLNLIIWGGALKWLLILAPIIIGIILLPPLIKPYWDQYLGLVKGISSVGAKTNVASEALKNVSPSQLQEVIKLLGM